MEPALRTAGRLLLTAWILATLSGCGGDPVVGVWPGAIADEPANMTKVSRASVSMKLAPGWVMPEQERTIMDLAEMEMKFENTELNAWGRANCYGFGLSTGAVQEIERSPYVNWGASLVYGPYDLGEGGGGRIIESWSTRPPSSGGDNAIVFLGYGLRSGVCQYAISVSVRASSVDVVERAEADFVAMFMTLK